MSMATFISSLVRWFVGLFVRWFVGLLVHLLVRSFVCLFVDAFVRWLNVLLERPGVVWFYTNSAMYVCIHCLLPV